MTATLDSSVDYDLLIGGCYVLGTGGDRILVHAPTTGEVCGSVADGSVADAITAIDAAQDAFTMWRETPPRHRAEVLRRCYELMTERSESIARLISLENGKTLSDARGEVAYAADFFRWYGEETVRAIGQISTSPSGNNKIIVQHQPIGVAVLITPWNFPAAMATRKIAPALAAGCTTVLKPATETPLTAYLIADICAEAGVPTGAINVVTTRRPGPVVSAMLHDPRVRAMSFTGSTEVGRHLLREAADQILKCSMELGGNAPFLVFDDAHMDGVLEGLMVAKMRNGGQACTAANRIYAHCSVAAELGERLGQRMSSLRVGPSLEESTQCGPLISRGAVDKVHALVTDALDKGANLITGGVPSEGDGCFYAPTVLSDVPADADIVAEEIFGPVATIISFDTDDEAIAAANATRYGLSAYVYTSDLAKGMRIAERLESGMVAINRGLVSDAAAPFGGVKQSGLGREGGHDGILEYMEPKYLAVSW